MKDGEIGESDEKTNPYASRPGSQARLASSRGDANWPLRIGLCCSLVGPVFLVGYYAWFDIQLGLVESLQFLSAVYVFPALLGMLVGLGSGRLLRKLPFRLSLAASVTILVAIFVFWFPGSIYLLVNDHLNTDLDLGVHLPMFSLMCTGGTFFVTAASRVLL